MSKGRLPTPDSRIPRSTGKRRGGMVVGITGGIASGKSTFAGMLRRRGAAYYSVDRAAHLLYRPGRPAYRRIVRVFGRGIVGPGGRIDRRKLGAAVFSSRARMRRLEGIVHPALRRVAAAEIRRRRARHRLTAEEVGPLLFKLGVARHVDVVVVIGCRRAEQVRRLVSARPGTRRRRLSREEALRRVRAFSKLERALAPAASRLRRRVFLRGDGPPRSLEAAAAAITRHARECCDCRDECC